MNTNKKFLFFLIGLLLTFLVPNYAAALGFAPIDTNGKLLYFGGRGGSIEKPTLVYCPSGKTCSADGSGSVNGVGAQYKYTNVITVNGVQVDAYVTVEAIDSAASITNFDYLTPNPGGGSSYTTNSGSGIASQSIPEAAVFAPRITVKGTGGVTFLIEFKDTSGKPVSLKNVYNNSVDIEDVEVVEYGGFSSYELSNINPIPSGNGANCSTPGGTGSVEAHLGDNHQVKFKGGVGVCIGLYLEEFARIQTKFDSISSLRIKMGQESGNGIRYYGSIFVHDEFVNTGGSTKTIAPTVNLLTTTKTKPTLTGKIGGEVSTNSPDGSPLVSGDTFTVNVAGTTYTAGDGKLSTSGVNWTLNIPTDLTAGQTYEVIATRNSVLVDQTNNELVISPICVKPQMLNSAGTACVTPAANDITLCHSGNGVNYAKVTIPSSGLNGHETHQYDVLPDGSGRCPDAPTDKACTAVGQPFPAGAQTDGKKVTICHFPPGNTDNVQMISISVNALAVHVGHHYDTIWEVGKSCPRTIDDCDNPNDTTLTNPTVDFLTTTESMPTLTGTIGNLPATSATAFSVQVNGKTYTYSTAGNSNTVKNGVIITGTDWSLQTTTAIPPGNYEVIATRTEGTGSNKITLIDEQAKELTILPSCKDTEAVIDGQCVALPTVVIKQIDGKLYDGVTAVKTSNTKPVISGIVGDKPLGADEDFIVIVNNVQYSKKAGKVSVPDNMNWTLTMPVDLPVGIYDIVADRDNGLGDTTHEEMEITPPMPTVIDNKNGYDTTPTIKGTVGTIDLAPTDTFSVTVKMGSKDAVTGFVQQVYTYKTDAALTVNGKNWELTIPDSKALEAGTYEIEAMRSTVKDESSDELVVNMQCRATETLFNGVCKPNSEFPTVDILETADTMPTLTGIVGTSPLTNAEEFTVEVAGTGQIYSKSSGAVHVSGTVWTVDVTTALAVQNYDIIATRDSTLKDRTSNELTIIACVEPKKIKNGKCVTESKTPTVEKLVTDASAQSIALKGTVGDVVLSNGESFTVKIHNSQHSDIPCTLPRPTTTEWTCTLTSKPFVAGIFDVDAKRGTVLDETSGELTITDNIAICDVSNLHSSIPYNSTPSGTKTKLIPKSEWISDKEGQNYHVGACEDSTHTSTEPKPFPDEPQALQPQKTVAASPYCDDGGVRSQASATGVKIKRATIVNATTVNGTVETSLTNSVLKYGEKVSAVGNVIINLATVDRNSASGVRLEGVTVNNAYIDTPNDFINADGSLNANGTFISVIGGTTKKSVEDPYPVSTIVSGMIVAGTADGKPVRGILTNGRYNVEATPVSTKSRRIRGTLTNATITDAHITTNTVNGVSKTVIDSGIIEAGIIEGAVTSAFGTVINATIEGAELSESNHCFSSGTIGNKGQLNWKEVVK